MGPVQCPNCGEYDAFICGTVWDDDEFLGDCLECRECHHQWPEKSDSDDLYAWDDAVSG